MEIKAIEAPLLKVVKETHDIRTFGFDARMDFKPGQFIMLKAGGRSEAFSISSSPFDSCIEVSMKMGISSFKKAMEDAKIGDTFEIKGPYGVFSMDENKDAIMLAGGIGVTPFRSMIRYATAKKLPTRITLLYSNKTLADIAFRDELEMLEKENKNFRVINTITRHEGHEWKGRTGRIDEGMVKSIRGWENAMFYLCGPPAMVDGMAQLLAGMGIQKERIRMEKFTGYL
jgi:ferredoxin-NADP reductase